MAFTTPGTAVAGEVLTAAFWNEQVRDNLNALDDAGANAVGLVHINTTTVTAQTTFSVNNCFSADYDNYLMVVTGLCSANISMNLRLRLAGVDSAGGFYIQQSMNRDGTTQGGNRATTTGWTMSINDTHANEHFLLINGPNLSRITGMSRIGGSSAGGGAFIEFGKAIHNFAGPYDGYTFLSGTANTFTGTIRLYGLRNG